MDIIEYISGDELKLKTLAKQSQLQILRLRRLIADPQQPVRYMTAKRLAKASSGQITIEALSKRGPLRGMNTFSGPLGQVIAEIASSGPDIPTRLAAFGIASDHFTEILLRGRVPRPEYMEAYLQAFSPGLAKEHFFLHAAWRKDMAKIKDGAA